MPDPVSVADHWTLMLAELCVAGSGCTWLAGVELSSALDQVRVCIAGFSSNTIDALLLMTVPVGKSFLGDTVNKTFPSPSGGFAFGGRKPANGSVGGNPVAGSSETKFQVRRPEDVLSLPLIRTIKLLSGRRSTSVVKFVLPIGITRRSPKLIGPKRKEFKSSRFASS